MNFEVLKTDFKSYLDEQKVADTGNNEEETNVTELVTKGADGEFSLFDYADEFKSYLEEKKQENNSEIKSKSVDDVIKMHFSSEGQLINSENKKDETDDNSIMTMSVLTEEYVKNTQTSLLKNETSLLTAENTEKSSDDDVFTNVFNELLKEDKFKNTIDTDKSGEIDEDEMKVFVEKIKDFDENDKDVSVNDLLIAAEQIKNDVFNVPKSEDKFTEKEVEDIKKDITDSKPSSIERVPSRSNIGGVAALPRTGSSTSGKNLPNTYNSSISLKNSDNMSEKELKAELLKAKKELSAKQSVLASVINETNSAIKALKANTEKAYETYNEKVKSVDVDMAKQVEELHQKINAKQEEINKKDAEIANKENSVTGAENAYNNAQSSRKNLEGILNDLKSGSKDKNTNSQISDIKSQLETAKKAEETAKNAVEKEKKEAEKLKQERKELEEGDNGLNKLKDDMSKLEADIAAKYPEIKEAQAQWDKAKETFETEKTKASDKAKSEVTNAQKQVNNVEKAITNYNNNESTGKYNSQYNEAAGKKLAAAAHNVRGTVGYCLGGVADSLEAVYGYGAMPDIMSAYQAADILASDTGIGAHFKEVQVKREDLPKLPAGAVVVWDNNANGGGSNVSAAGKVHGHISIALGNGQESSDHIAAQIVNRDATFRVFFPKS